MGGLARQAPEGMVMDGGRSGPRAQEEILARGRGERPS